MTRTLIVRGQDVVDVTTGERFLAFDDAAYADAFVLGYNEGDDESVGRTHTEDLDWNRTYDAGRYQRWDDEGWGDQWS